MIELKNVCFRYAQGEKENGLQNIDLTIPSGEVVLLCGESGCGKTTLTRLLNGLIPNYYKGKLEGEVLVDGQPIDRLPLYETAKAVGSVFQNPRSQFFNVDTNSELVFGCENRGLPVEEIGRRMAQAVEEFELSPLLNRSIFQLSGGEKQKIACASVSLGQPGLFVLDEPSSNLDRIGIQTLRRMIALWKAQGKTIVIAEHRLHFLRELMDRAIFLKEGRIAREFTAREIGQLDRQELAELGLRPLELVCGGDCREQPEQEEEVWIKEFHFSYDGRTRALEVGSLRVPVGSTVAIIGHNGAGKSTFARCLCGLEKRCRGVVEIAGRRSSGKKRLKECYMVMQDVNHQLFTESVLDEVLLSMEKPEEKEAEAILEKLDLLHLKDRHPLSLSGGQKQRVAIASAVASRREMILFDEPSSGLDLRHMDEVAENLRQLQELGKTQFVISHDLELILRSCSRVVRMEKGRIVEEYPLDEAGKGKLAAFFACEEVV